MEKKFIEYMDNIFHVIQERTIREMTDSVKPLGKFYFNKESGWIPFPYRGYTFITPIICSDEENQSVYKELQQIKKNIRKVINNQKFVEAPDDALHMTVARLISGEKYEDEMEGKKDEEFLNYLKVLLDHYPTASSSLEFEINGISILPQGIVAAVVSPLKKEDYIHLQVLRDTLYHDSKLSELGVERKRGFNGHITLFYIEEELSLVEKKDLMQIMIELNKGFNSIPYKVKQIQVRKFDNYLKFFRQEHWPVLNFSKFERL